MNERRIDRAIDIWLAFPNEASGTVSGVVSYSSKTDGVRFHDYSELMTLLRRLSTDTPSAGNENAASVLRLAS